jgi:hypothetical protein
LGPGSASGEIEGPAGKGRKEIKKKRLFFDACEATILLKTKGRDLKNAQNELVFRHKLAPKCTQKQRFLPNPDLICTF